ncbi:ATP-binding cassette domain-containing protein [Phyllobacterium sp. 21LDTY02-6]|jgi:ribose transport system ATP-binding protein|uniref:ATP-binding cassette domain-containing protein n=1 Tax=Phyllobacterium sp. 21LDTY02-6 TaxID=2944903 RepID=UPI002021B6E5|nr:ATP-binding cassette domain-containing protein [Phyllobacterium sp. 21LDTY02-6]MCO4319094.1 ATP-binding cassette domain-containing protein [Phyllobacterium sp. 21LDTY02-6]
MQKGTSMPESEHSTLGTSSIHRLLAEAGLPNIAHAPVRTLRVENLEKRYGETVALTNANVTFSHGVHTILGENGSGKSTMLKILSGVVAPTHGRVVLDDHTVSGKSPADMKALGLATVFQEVLIAPHRSVVENIFLGFDGLVTRKVSKSGRETAADAVLSKIARFPIDLHAAAGGLSLAAQQLVVIARALINRPSILLLDEATAALDYADRDLVFEAIEDYAASGNIVIFISHRLEEVKRLSDKVTVLRSGHVVDTLDRQQINSQILLKLMAPEAHLDVE